MWPIIDALKIDSEFRTEKSAFRALPSSPELNEIFDQLVDKLNISRRELARKLKVNNNSVEAWCGHGTSKQHPIPLWVLDFVISQTGDDLNIRLKVNSLIDKIRCGRTGTVQAFPRNLNPELAALIGAHCADDSLTRIPHRESLSWQLVDQEKESIELASKWVKSNFEIELKVGKLKNANAWEIHTRKQILPRFLVSICDMPIGEKHGIVREPRILRCPERDNRLLTKPSKSQKKELELSFASGVIIFDGHCTITGGVPSVGIGSNSKQLLVDLLRIFKVNGIEFGNFIRYNKILTTSFRDSKKFFEMNCFQNTKKQRKLESLLFHKHLTNYPES